MTTNLGYARTFEGLLSRVVAFGEDRTDRTGTGTRSLFAPGPLEFDLDNVHVPLITSKAVPWKMALRELMWMLSGSTDVNDLAQRSPQMARIWSNWANRDGDVGPTYGAQYRNAGGSLLITEPASYGFPYELPVGTYGVDQLRQVITRLLEAPDTRRAVISLWSAPELEAMGIEPCVVTLQFSLRGTNYDQLHLQVYQRSADMMLGVPFDIFQAGVLAHLVARELNHAVGHPKRGVHAVRLVWSAGDVHVYHNQMAAARQQLNAPVHPMTAQIIIDPYPTLSILDNTLEAGHIRVHNYESAPAISAPLAV